MDTLKTKEVFKQGNDKIKFAFKNMSNSSIRSSRETDGSGQFMSICFNNLLGFFLRQYELSWYGQD